MIIAVSNLKGGVGKSSVSILLAEQMAKRKKRVLLVDADEQGSASDWAALREDSPPFTVIAMNKPVIHRDLPAIAEDYDHVIIDCPPRIATVTRSAIMAADLVLIPITPSSFDLMATEQLLSILEEARVVSPALQATFLLNRVIANTVIGRDTAVALKDFDIPLIKSKVHQRTAIAECAGGYLLSELDPKGKAVDEYNKLHNEILKLENQ